MANSKASIKKAYDSLREQLKAGKITAAEMAAKGKEMHKKYFSNDNKGQRAKDSAPPKRPGGRSSTPSRGGSSTPSRGGSSTPSTDHPIMSSSSTYTGDRGRRTDGTRGKPMPSNPPGQRQARTRTEPVRNRRGRTTGTKQVPVKPPKPTRPKTNRRGRRI